MSAERELNELAETARESLSAATTTDELREVEVRYLGRKSRLNEILRDIRSLSDAEKRVVGPLGNAIRRELEAAIAARGSDLARAEEDALLATDRIDLTLPGRRPARGAPHPLGVVMSALEDVFVGLGYEVAEGPEAETDWYNFQALNIPPDHPARGLMDTYYVEGPGGTESALMRTHTSPVQIRVMESRRPPIYIVCPGRAYRVDAPDATHLPVFNQIEGLAVDDGLSFTDLRGSLQAFCEGAFGPRARARLVPSYYQFTEPSCELQITCPLCDGRGCAHCASGWLGIGGAGMVDPNVFEAVGIDPERYTGFAFGLSIEKSAMFRYEIWDMRQFLDPDHRLLEQFHGVPVTPL